ncbi:hypothetical protein EUGRSUZ_J03102 [Eucalyptus grandis]|uniref:Uncharacterized protein n=2 Tax=Eucalyptus grandis TaxID=71139 RepID=A0ACC3JB41_EUCGR|nr:hypothetical protein EUGRSUZ_J03102 [Eucalyptus grandis]
MNRAAELSTYREIESEKGATIATEGFRRCRIGFRELGSPVLGGGLRAAAIGGWRCGFRFGLRGFLSRETGTDRPIPQRQFGPSFLLASLALCSRSLLASADQVLASGDFLILGNSMAEEAAAAAAQPLTYVQEAILKKRKSTEELALRRRAQLQLRQKRSKHSKSSDFKMPEQFIKDFREKELDLIRMKHRVKRRAPPVAPTNAKLLFIIRIQGKNDMHPKTKKILNNLRLRRVLSGVFVKATEGILAMLQKVEPYVTYG